MNDDWISRLRVIPEPETIVLCNSSKATWERMKARGETPPMTQISPRRVGYRVTDIEAWLDARRRGGAA
jgi:predicted DNA-binding transcriptional regulator AlpA